MLLCVIGYKYSCTSIVIFLFKSFEAFGSIYFAKTGISLLCFNTSSKEMWYRVNLFVFSPCIH